MKEYIGKILSKRTLYLCCFIAFHLIDFFRNSLNGDGWSAAANATGLVMFVVIISGHSLTEYFNVGNLIWTILAVVVAFLPSVFGVFRPLGLYEWTYVLAVLNVWWIVLVAVRFIKQMICTKHFPVKIKGRAWLWIAITILMTFSVSGKVWPIWFLAMFGLFYLTDYDEKDRADMLDGMVNGTIVAFFALQIYAYGFRPYDEVRYKGAFSNCNITSLHYLVVYCMVLVKLHLLEQKNAKKGWKFFYLLLAGGVLGFMFMTMGRTSWLAAVVLTVCYGVFVIRRKWKKKWNAVIGRGVALVISAMILFPAVFLTVRWLPTILHHPVWYEGEYSIDKVHSYDDADSDKYVEMDEFLDAVFGRILGTIRFGRNNPFVLKAHAAEITYEVIPLAGTENMDASTRIRLAIYKAYLRDLTWIGNDSTKGYYNIEGSDYHSWHAQNLWIQVAYTYGIPSGILFVIMTFATIVAFYRKMKKSNNAYAIIPFCVCVIFFMYGTLELVWNIGQMVLLLFFFVQHPQIGVEMVQTEN